MDTNGNRSDSIQSVPTYSYDTQAAHDNADFLHHIHRPSSSSSYKRPRLDSDTENISHGTKRIKAEEPSVYSESVRKKLAATTRTGQACDRCKERKMKCDPDPVACQPCRLKSLRCYTTDRVTGQSRERGQSDRVENEISYLRDQVTQYQTKYGPLPTEGPSTPYSAFSSPARERGSLIIPPTSHPETEVRPPPEARGDIPSSQYIGWPTPDQYGAIHNGPVVGTKVDILDWGSMDSGDFDCDIMRESSDPIAVHFNFSTGSILRTIHQQQKIYDDQLQLPPKSDTMAMADIFLTVMWGFVPMVHRGSFRALVHRLYDTPQDVALAEKLQIVQVLSILNHQNAIRNHAQAHKIRDSYRYFHYVLGHFPSLLQDDSLAAMQALTMVLVQFRNLPKPGYTWRLAQELLLRAIDLNYHRDPDKIDLLPEEDNILAKELRKRVFHSILGICVATGCRLGRPAPWQFVQWDVPLPLAIKDSEISEGGLQAERSGQCDFWQCIALAKLLPLYTELYNYVLSVRKSPSDYVKIVEALKLKIEAWRVDWDVCIQREDKDSLYVQISTLLIDTWAAEFLLNLHHPSVCTSRTTDVLEKNLDVCQKAAKRMLGNFHVLSRVYKAADFTWHSIVAYTLGFGLTLHIFRRRTNHVTQEQFDTMKNELAGWKSLMAYADLVLRTENRLLRSFEPLVEQVQKQIERHIITVPNYEAPSAKLPAIQNQAAAHRTNSVIKQERSPQSTLDTAPHYNTYPATNGHSMKPQFPQPDSPYNGGLPYQNGQSALPRNPYTIYSPSVMQYPSLPTSLAPILNGPPTSMQQYRHSSMAIQDPMMFSPHLYTDAAAVWPMVPEGTNYS